MRTTFFLMFLCLIIFGSWTLQQKTEIQRAEWLVGTWKNKTSRGNIYEAWIKVSDHELAGKSYIVKEKDTIIFETIRLVQEQNGLFYIPTVNNQNNNSPVRFALKTISDTELVFENPQHDFPQIISYVSINKDSLVAEISGTKNGQKGKQTFPMKRVTKSYLSGAKDQ